jgi:hypothetical protein
MKTRPHLIPALIAAVMLLVVIFPLPYGYYQFLRWAICAVAIFIAYMAYRWGKPWAIWVFGAMAVLFNPIWPITFTKEIWIWIDVACALLFGASFLFIQRPTEDTVENNK